jgi:hypothetical protein
MITSKIIFAATEPPNNKISCEQEEASDPPIAHNAEGKEALEQEVWEPPTQQQEIVRGEEEEVGRPAIAMGPRRGIVTAAVMSSSIPRRRCRSLAVVVVIVGWRRMQQRRRDERT